MSEELSPIDLIWKFEERLLQGEVRHSPEEVAELLADDFVEFGSSGRIFDRQTTIDALQHESPVEIALTPYQAKLLAPDVVLLTYRATVAASTHSLRSSIWQRLEGRWQLVFHQGTPLKV